MNNTLAKNKHSLGSLRKAKQKTKPKSPDLLGELHLQRQTFETIAKEFKATGKDEIICGIAGWGYCDEEGYYVVVQLSPPYPASKVKMPKPNILTAIFGGEDEQ